MGAIRFSSLFETQSTPALVLGFNFLITSNIVISDTDENLKRESFCFRYDLNDLDDGWTSSANCGPIPAKKSLKPFAISDGLLRIS